MLIMLALMVMMITIPVSFAQAEDAKGYQSSTPL